MLRRSMEKRHNGTFFDQSVMALIMALCYCSCYCSYRVVGKTVMLGRWSRVLEVWRSTWEKHAGLELPIKLGSNGTNKRIVPINLYVVQRLLKTNHIWYEWSVVLEELSDWYKVVGIDEQRWKFSSAFFRILKVNLRLSLALEMSRHQLEKAQKRSYFFPSHILMSMAIQPRTISNYTSWERSLGTITFYTTAELPWRTTKKI